MSLATFILLVLSASWPALGAQQIATSKAAWEQQRQETSDLSGETTRPVAEILGQGEASAPQEWTALVPDGAPLVLPQPVWPPSRKIESGRGWQLKNPAVGTGSLVTTYEDSRTAVQIAQDQQESAMTQAAPPAPLMEDLPDELQQLNLRLEFGVEFRF
ncbi:MAG: hypothetical protein KGY54_14665 [Oleiphilaceae bacterium]|nr:hypothetical protein [Oleiphilaceae bacterium]